MHLGIPVSEFLSEAPIVFLYNKLSDYLKLAQYFFPSRHSLNSKQFKQSNSVIIFNMFFVDFIDWEGEILVKIHRLSPIQGRLTRDWTCSLGMYPDWELNQGPFLVHEEMLNQLGHTGQDRFCNAFTLSYYLRVGIIQLYFRI